MATKQRSRPAVKGQRKTPARHTDRPSGATVARITTKEASRSDQTRYWSGQVTKHSNALDLEVGVFTWKDPTRIAASLKRSAEESERRKGTPFQSAMSMLNFYINRAGRGHIAPEQLKVLERAKVELRRLFGK